METTATETTATAAGAGAAATSRVFESLRDEHDYLVDELEGALPEGLSGTLYRNGPAINDVGGSPYGHLFDGDGMLSQFTLDGGRVRYRNRFVRTEHYLRERDAARPLLRGFGTQRPGGVLGNAFRTPANVGNTSVVMHAGNLLALWEGGHPFRLDPDTLETLGKHDFDGALRRAWAFSAHPKVDPETGELFNFGIQYGPATRLRAYRVGARGTLRQLRAVTLPYPVMLHDFALTERHLVFVVSPIVLRLWRFLLGLRSYDGALRFDPRRATRIVLVPRDGGEPRVAECEAFFHWHVGGAFEDGDGTVVDLVGYEDFDIDRSLGGFSTAGFEERGRLLRLRVGSGDEAERSELLDWSCEFPQLDGRRTGRPYRFAYATAVPGGVGLGRAVAKLDTVTGERRAHDFGEGQVAGEPVFVPRAADAAEDDGWLLTLVYSAAEHRSRLVVLDARDLEGEPLAVAHLRHHVPFNFHGTFTRRVAA